eukprot:m.239637 g.239637  ORF g.239637 m.239637 type:complete len:907 (+) comp18980_c0_seq9:247-2967(+)
MAHAFGHKFAHVRNKVLSEGELRNVHLEIKEVDRPWEALVKQRGKATKNVLQWAETQSNEVQQFLKSVTELEKQSIEAAAAYGKAHRSFARSFKELLVEKVSLCDLEKDLKKAQNKLETWRKKEQSDERKLGKTPPSSPSLSKRRQSVSMAKAAIDEAEREEAVLLQQVHDAGLRVERELHDLLRQAFFNLSEAEMTYLHKNADIQEQVMRTIEIFPRVKAIKEVEGKKGQFEFDYEAYPEAPGPCNPIWHLGERFAQLLDLERENDADRDRKRSATFGSELDRVQGTAAARERHLKQQLQEAQTYVRLLEGAVQDQQYRVANTALMQTQVVVMQAAAAGEQGLGALVLEHGERASMASATLLEMLQQGKIEAPAELTIQAQALSMTVESLLLTAYGFARSSMAEDSMSLIPLAAAVGSAAGDVISQATERLSEYETHFDRDALVPPSVESTPATSAAGSSVSLGEHVPRPTRHAPGPPPGAPRSRSPSPGGRSRRHSRSPRPARSGNVEKPPADMIRQRSPSPARLGDRGMIRHESESTFGFPAPTPSPHASPEKAGLPPAARGPVVQPPTPSRRFPMVSDKGADPQLLEAGRSFVAALNELTARTSDLIERDADLVRAARISTKRTEQGVDTAQELIDEAVSTVSHLQSEANAKYSGRKLETNTALLFATNDLLGNMKGLIAGAKKMKNDLGQREGSRLSKEEMQRKHGKWLGNFSDLTASTIEAIPMLMESLRQVLQGQGKHEEMQVASRTVAALAAQLVSSSRTKQLNKGCESDKEVQSFGDKIIGSSHAVQAAVRECHNLILAGVLIDDFGDLNPNQVKKLVMSTQVNVLKLETTLQSCVCGWGCVVFACAVCCAVLCAVGSVACVCVCVCARVWGFEFASVCDALLGSSSPTFILMLFAN